VRLLIISHGVVGERMAGPGIRYWELARILSQEFEVILAAPGKPTIGSPGFRLKGYEADGGVLADLMRVVDVVMVSGDLLRKFPFLKEGDKPLVMDLYDPFTLENLEMYSERPLAEQRGIHDISLAILNELLQVGDFFICASEKQRAFWLGMLSALNRVNPVTYGQDRSLRKLIEVVPFGLPSEGPRHERDVLKGVWEGIAPQDKVVLWGGGIYNWLDPLTLIWALSHIVEVRQDIKLFFMGIKHPNPLVYTMRMCTEAIRLSKELGLYNKHIFFNDWVAYGERQNYLLEADVGISLHLDHIETTFSFRTRVLDYIWAGLPMIVTRGDDMSDLVERYGLGKVVDYQDVEGLSAGLLEMLDQPCLKEAYAPGFEEIRGRLTWSRVAAPLVEFCRSPRLAPGRITLEEKVTGAPSSEPSPTPWRLLPNKAWRCYRDGGVRELWEEIRNYLRWWKARRAL
jgi:glycosyltransferase involved in cell wall biosynthesis